MADKLGVWVQACVHLGLARVTSLTEDTETRYVFDDAWPGVLAEAFNSGDWNRFKKTVQLSASSTGTASVGFSYVYDYPADYVRTVTVSPNTLFDSIYEDWRDEGGYLHANTTPVYLRYISNNLADDAGVQYWPDMFWRYVAVLLAFETCERLTQSTTSVELLAKLLERTHRKAKNIDARNENNKVLRSGSWLRARGGTCGSSSSTTSVGGSISPLDGDV